jgi:hypothetical protein
MIADKYNRQIYTEKDLCDLYLSNPELQLKNTLVSDLITFDPELNLNVPELIQYTLSDKSIEEFDETCRNNWFLPEQYKDMDIAQFILEQCTSDAELQRAGEELLLYQERDMFILLKYLKYLVDTMRENNIVWGVGRGSSVASFVLFLLGIHRINSLHYDLSIKEFLK